MAGHSKMQSEKDRETLAPVVLVVEDRLLLAESLAFALRAADAEVEIVAEPTIEAVRDAVERHAPTVALVALGFGKGLTEAAVALLCEHGIPVMVMTGGDDRLRLARCVAEGAVGIVDKSMDVETLIQMTRDAGGIDSFLSRTQRYQYEDELRRHRSKLAARRRPLQDLTPREREVLRDLTLGMRAAEIAERSFVSVSTVRSQIKSILSKLGVSSQIQAVAIAARSDWFVGVDA